MFESKHVHHSSVRRQKIVQSTIGITIEGSLIRFSLKKNKTHCLENYTVFVSEHAVGLETRVTGSRFAVGKRIIVFGSVTAEIRPATGGETGQCGDHTGRRTRDRPRPFSVDRRTSTHLTFL